MRTSARDSVSEASSTESQWCESWSWMLKQRMVWKRKISNETWDIHWKYTSIHEISNILHILHALHAKIAWWLKHQKSRGPRELASFWKASLGQLSFSDYLHAPGKLTRLYKHYQIVISKEHMSHTRYLQRLKARTDSNHHLNGQFRRPKDPFPLPLGKTSQPMMPICWICFNQMCECGIVWSSSYRTRT